MVFMMKIERRHKDFMYTIEMIESDGYELYFMAMLYLRNGNFMYGIPLVYDIEELAIILISVDVIDGETYEVIDIPKEEDKKQGWLYAHMLEFEFKTNIEHIIKFM
jgi:hypothetical protein